MVTGYCMKCKAKREVKDAKFELNKLGRPIARGKCATCGTSMYKILSAEEGAKAGLKATPGKGSRKSRKSGGSRKSRKSASKSKGSRKSRKSASKSKGSRKSRKSRKGSRKSRK
jgi:hypothetical protein